MMFTKNSKPITLGIVFVLAIILIVLTTFTVSELQETKRALIIKQDEFAKKDSLMANILKEQIAILDSIDASIKTNFDYAFLKFRAFNDDIDSSTVRTFAKVMTYYGLDSTDYHRDMYTGQILLESGARQRKKDGSVLVGLAGEIGMCQIKPTTCFDYLEKKVDSADIKIMLMLGATEFPHVFDDRMRKEQKIRFTKVWLGKVRNNIIMWGFMTRLDLDKKGDINTQLVSYNMGTAGMYRYKKNGGSINGHAYIRKIKSKLLVSSH